MKKNKAFTILELFLTMLKIGLFTFGGGYAMISILESEFVEKKKWIERDEFTDMVAISESTPGPIAINSATYIGYRTAGFWGSFFSTLGMCIPSFVIIYVISLFFDKFLSFKYVQYAFNGIQACVTFIILSAGVKLFVKSKKTVFSCILFGITVTVMFMFSLFGIKFSSIYYILIGAGTGLLYYFITLVITKIKGEKLVKEGGIHDEKNEITPPATDDKEDK